MGRWSQYDNDDYRLPQGFTRVGYDADSRRHYFRDSDGALWEGPEGASYGEMTKVTNAPVAMDGDNDGNDDPQMLDVEAAGPNHQDGYISLNPNGMYDDYYRPTSSPYRALFPFFLLISITLLLVWRLFASLAPPPPPPPACPASAEPYIIRAGDTCWDLARARGTSVDALKLLNGGDLVCDRLRPGQHVCVPVPASTPAAAAVPQRRSLGWRR